MGQGSKRGRRKEKEESKNKKDQFVIKRGLEGKSFDTIAKELAVTKATLIQWSKEFKEDISNLENFEKEKMIEKYKAGKKIRFEAIIQDFIPAELKTF